MNVAIAMKNEHELQDDHFGQAPFYRVYELQGKSHIFVEKRSNTHHGTHKHEKAREIEEILGDCNVWIGRQMGKKSVQYLTDIGITTFQTTETEPEKALHAYLAQTQ